MKNVILIVCMILAVLGYSYLLGALVTWLFSLAFGFEFTWLRAFWVWLALTIATGGISIKINYK